MLRCSLDACAQAFACESRNGLGNTTPARAAVNPWNQVRPAGLEPATLGLEIPCSIHLSYGRVGGIRGPGANGETDGKAPGSNIRLFSTTGREGRAPPAVSNAPRQTSAFAGAGADVAASSGRGAAKGR